MNAAWLAKLHAAQTNFADGELPADQVIERDTAGDDVAARVGGLQFDFVVALDSFDGFGFDERDVVAGAGFPEIPVAFETAPGNGADGLNR